MFVQESIYDFKDRLYQGEEFYMKSIPCQRRYVKPGFRITQNHLLFLTNYRIIFTGPYNEVFPMQIMIRDIVKTTKKVLKNTNTVLFKVDLRHFQLVNDTKKQIAYIWSIQNSQHLQQLQKYLNILIKSEDKSEALLKKHVLLNDKVLSGVYQNLVVNTKMITEEQFWQRHKYILEFRLDQQLQYTKSQNQQKPQLIDVKTSHNNRHQQKTNQFEYQGYSIQRQIQNLSLNIKINEVNQQTRQNIIRQIQDMYLRDSQSYQKMRVTAPQDLANQGIILIPKKKHMQVQQFKEQQHIESPPVKIPIIDDIKFRITRDDVMNLIHNSDAGIKYRKKIQTLKQDPKQKQRQEKQKDLTKKVIEYVNVFYMMMKKRQPDDKSNNNKIGDMEKQIQTLKQEVDKSYNLDKGKELLTFINRALNNYMLHRKNQFFT